jgi:LysM repeat protein
MRNWKRLFYYLFINILVSACVTVAVLTIWDRVRGPNAEPVAQIPGDSAPASGASANASANANLSAQNTGAPPAVPEPTASEEAPAEPSRSTFEYAVQSGDTLGRIADRFDVTIEEIIAANELEDPNRLEIGQVLNIPGQPEDASVETQDLPEETQPSPAATGESPSGQGNAQVVVDSVVGAGDLNSERVLVKNTGAGELSMQGWQLLEEDGEVFTFPRLTLFADGAVYVYTRAGQPTVVDLYWGMGAPVWDTGETVVLLDDLGEVRATYRVP